MDIVNKVCRLTAAFQNSLYRDLAVTRPLAGSLAEAIVKRQFNTGTIDWLPVASPIE
jgi:hypothetical protein